MSHSFVNQLIHVMWSTNNQQYLLPHLIQNELHAYITTLVKSKRGKVFACGGSADHIHILLLLPPDISLSNLLNQIKSHSSKWIKTRSSVDPNFSWQSGYLAFSVQKDRINHACNYIISDAARHQSPSKPFSYADELTAMLQQQDIQYNPQYYLQNSRAKILLHAVWSTNNRVPYLDKEYRPNLYVQAVNIVANCRGKVHEIGGVDDHIHILMEVPKDRALSDLMLEIKTRLTHWLKSVNSSKYRDFEWQTGYGAFSISLSSVEAVRQYIQQQEAHHCEHTYQGEWNEFLLKKAFCILVC